MARGAGLCRRHMAMRQVLLGVRDGRMNSRAPALKFLTIEETETKSENLDFYEIRALWTVFGGVGTEGKVTLPRGVAKVLAVEVILELGLKGRKEGSGEKGCSDNGERPGNSGKRNGICKGPKSLKILRSSSCLKNIVWGGEGGRMIDEAKGEHVGFWRVSFHMLCWRVQTVFNMERILRREKTRSGPLFVFIF